MYIWDDALKKMVLELTYGSPVMTVRLRRDQLIVVLRNNIHVYTFPNNPQKQMDLDTRDNPKGTVIINRHLRHKFALSNSLIYYLSVCRGFA